MDADEGSVPHQRDGEDFQGAYGARGARALLSMWSTRMSRAPGRNTPIISAGALVWPEMAQASRTTQIRPCSTRSET